MQNAGLDEAQAGIKIAGRNINNRRYADDTTLMTESEEELKNLLIKVKKESEKVGLKLNIHAWNLDWRSILYMVTYMFQCYSLKSSHPHLLPQSPKVCSLHLCLFCCLTYRVIITIFLNSTYMHYYTVLVFFFLTYLTQYNRLQFHPPH